MRSLFLFLLFLGGGSWVLFFFGSYGLNLYFCYCFYDMEQVWIEEIAPNFEVI